MEKDLLIEKIKQIAIEGRISCTEARKLAEDLEINPIDVGEACNEARIKIYGCELGCFR